MLKLFAVCPSVSQEPAEERAGTEPGPYKNPRNTLPNWDF